MGLRQLAVVQVPYYHRQPSVLEKCNLRNFGGSVTLTLTLDRVEVTGLRISGRDLPTYQIRSKSEKLCGRTDGRTHLTSNLPGHRLVMT